MRYRFILISIILIAIISSCKKDKQVKQVRTVTCFQEDVYHYLNHYKIDSICTSEICTDYLNIWKELFKEKNNISETFFDEHIILCQSRLNTGNNGMFFSICYKVQMDWAIAYDCDKFVIKINSESNLYHELPRNEYLSKDEIRIAINHNRLNSRIATVSNLNIKFSSMDAALNKLKEDANVNTLCISEMYVDETTGNLMLDAWAEYENEENSCIKGIIDLISGDTEVNDTPCVIIF